MKEIYFKRIEATANILIIVVAILLGGTLVQKYFFSLPLVASGQPPRVQPVVGEKMNVPDIDWSRQPKTLVLALQTGCRFCNESASFYKRIIQTVQDKNVKLVAVFPTEIEKSTAHLNELGLQKMEVKRSSLNDLQVSGTPTLILTNDKGEITNYWVGQLPPDKETEVISQLQ